MTDRRSTAGPTGGRPVARRAIGLGLVVALVAGGFGAAYLFLRDTPAEVGLGTPGPTTGAPGATTSTPAATAPAGTDASPGAVDPGDPDGTDGIWTVDPTSGSFADFSGSFVGYRVREELAGVGVTTAVGRTPDVEGELLVDGSSLVSVEVTADLRTLRSDSSLRDGQLRRQALESDRFPTATFRLGAPVALASLPEEGATISVTVTGELTLHGVSRAIEVPIEALRSGDVVTVVGSVTIVFADYGIARPQAARVLSVEESGTMEFQLHFRRTG
jgi:polyisoprenoid-binding protein YceI